jgi:AsmA protein
MRRSVLITLIAVAVLLAAGLALTLLIDANQFGPLIEARLTKSLGRTVKIGSMKLNILSGTVTASDLSVADDPGFSNAAFLRAGALKLSIDLWQVVFSHKLNVDGATIQTPEAVLIQMPSGQWNFSSLGARTSAQPSGADTQNGKLALSMKSLKIDNARLELTQPGGRPEMLENVNIEVQDFAPGTVFPFSFSAKIAGGGDVAIAGKAGPINPTDAADTPLTATVKVTKLNLAGTGTVPASTGIDGILSMDGTVTSNGQTVQMTGKTSVENVKLAPHGTATRSPLVFDMALTEDLKSHAGRMTRGDISVGGANASLTGTWSQQAGTTVLNMTLAAPAVPVSALEALLPALDIVLPAGSALEGGTAAATLALTGSTSALVTSGPVGLHDAKLKGFDLVAKMSQIATLAGIKAGRVTEIQTLSANVRNTPEGTSLQNIQLVLPAIGKLTGDGTISPGHALAFKMRAALHTGALVSTFAPSTIAFSITGTAADPQFHPDVAQLASQEINQRLKGLKVGGVDAGATAGSVLQDLFGSKPKK